MTCLYRHYNKNHELLYVGISLDVLARTITHRSTAFWFDDITTIRIERFGTRLQALEAERWAIIDEKPKHNIQHGDPEPPVIDWLPMLTPLERKMVEEQRRQDRGQRTLRRTIRQPSL